MEYLWKGISKVKDTVSQVDLIAKLKEATSNENGLASISLLNELSSRTDNPESGIVILRQQNILTNGFILKIQKIIKSRWQNSDGIN